MGMSLVELVPSVEMISLCEACSASPWWIIRQNVKLAYSCRVGKWMRNDEIEFDSGF